MSTYVLTDDGRSVSADLELDDLKIFKPVVASSPEKLAAARNRAQAKKVEKFLTRRDGRIRDDVVHIVDYGALTRPHRSGLPARLEAPVMQILRPKLELFADIDGEESLRLRANITAT